MLSEREEEDYNYINNIRITDFRSHNDIQLKPGKSSVLIVGSNGVGKTSILEAISIFSYGRGIRNAKFYDMVNKERVSFVVDLGLYIKNNFMSDYQTSYNKVNKVRKVLINNKEASATNTRKNIPMLWIAPYTEKIFTSTSGHRRSFFDRLVNIFDNEHSVRLNEYDKCLKQRARLLKECSKDISKPLVLNKAAVPNRTMLTIITMHN